jgi:DNA-binding response OmpR family regulator
VGEAMKILLVEDDFALAMGTEYALQAEGYEVVKAGNVEAARTAIDNDKPDLVLLDVMLPDGNGYELCKDIRSRGNMVPIIFLTAVGEEANIVQGLELGADDYVTKPYRVKELLSRISANLRRSKILTEVKIGDDKKEVYSFGKHEFNNSKFILYNEGQIVDCTPSELRLLRELVIHEGQVLTRTQLLERLYDTEDSFIDDNTLSVYMKRLRTKLGEDAAFIETVRGVGYRFVRKQ